MAKIKVGNAMPEYGWFEDFYDEASLTLKSHTGTKAVYEDIAGFDIVLQGTHLSYKGQTIKGGTVNSVLFLDDKGGTLISVTGGNFSGLKLTDALIKRDSLWDFMSVLTAGNDTISGSDVGCNLNFGNDAGNDVIIGGAGGSYFGGSEGNDTLRGFKGGNAWDTLSYQETFYRDDDKQGIKLDALQGICIDSWGDKDKISNFEELVGSVYKDQIKGSGADEALGGLRGADVIDGGKGWDQLRYHNDDRFGGHQGIVANLATGRVKDGFGNIDTVKNIEAVYGTLKNDSFIGNSGDNQFRGLDGTDKFDGGKGKDEVSFDWWDDLGQHGADVDLTLAKNQIKDDGFGNTETVKGIEALGGGEFADKLRLGSSGGWVRGNGGDDILTAGKAGDSLGGGGDNDVFVFLAASHIGTLAGQHSRVEDFEQGNDTIDLSAIGGLDFIGTAAFSGAAGELRYEQSGGSTFLLGDTDGDGSSDFALELKGTFALTGGDLTL